MKSNETFETKVTIQRVDMKDQTTFIGGINADITSELIGNMDLPKTGETPTDVLVVTRIGIGNIGDRSKEFDLDDLKLGQTIVRIDEDLDVDDGLVQSLQKTVESEAEDRGLKKGEDCAIIYVFKKTGDKIEKTVIEK